MIPKSEATILGYKILFDAKGNLITERISVDIKKLKKAMLNSSYGLHIAGSISYDTKYLYDEGGNIMNHMNLGNRKTLTRGQERDRYDQGGI